MAIAPIGQPADPLDERRRRADPRLDDEALHDRGRSRPARARLPVPDGSSPGRGAPPRRNAGGAPRDPRRRRSGDLRAPLRERSVGRLPPVVRGPRGARHPLDPGRPSPGHLLLRRREDAPRLAGRPGAALVAGPRLGPLVQRQRRPGPGDGGGPSRREGQPRVLPGPAVPDVARRPGRDAGRARHERGRVAARGEPPGRRLGGRRLEEDLVGRHHRRRAAPLPRLGLREGPPGRGDRRERPSRGPDRRRSPRESRFRSSTSTRRRSSRSWPSATRGPSPSSPSRS